MRFTFLIMMSVLLLISACRNTIHADGQEKNATKDSADKIDLNSASYVADTLRRSDLISNKDDTSNQYIYDFMKVIIADQKIDSTYGLDLNPGDRCSIGCDDSTFLRILLLDGKKLLKPFNYKTDTISSKPEKCLTRKDMDAMLKQKANLSGFHWDNYRLGFNLSNKKSWYRFSIPLFSCERQKAIICIEELCPGLCGRGKTLVFTRKNRKWTSEGRLNYYY